MKPWHLLIIALILAALAAASWITGAGDTGMGLLAIFFLVLIAQLPAVWVRMRGAGGLVVFLVALAVPLIPIEILLTPMAKATWHAGGDLSDIGVGLMLLAVPFVLLPAFVLTTVTMIAVKPLERD